MVWLVAQMICLDKPSTFLYQFFSPWEYGAHPLTLDKKSSNQSVNTKMENRLKMLKLL